MSAERHAILSPSSAARWLTCTPSARLEEQFPESSSDFAEEGRIAHAVCERLLLGEKYKDLEQSEYFNNEMEDYAFGYASYVKSILRLARDTTSDAVLNVEVQLDLSEYVPECFGTSDAIVIADGEINVIDFKYGKGVKVEAKGNPQMMLYALGALNAYSMMYDIRYVVMTIYQPRLDNVSVDTIMVSDLMSWAQNFLMPQANLAFEGKGALVAGDHCRFCKAKAQCKAMADKQQELAAYDFKDAALLTEAEIADILSRKEQFTNWLTAVEEYALNAALDGKEFPGYKIVEGRSVRKYVDDAKVANVLLNNGFQREDIYDEKLKTITAMEKMITKKTFSELLSDLVIKPEGKPTLVPEADPRPVFNSAQNDFKNIND